MWDLDPPCKYWAKDTVIWNDECSIFLKHILQRTQDNQMCETASCHPCWRTSPPTPDRKPAENWPFVTAHDVPPRQEPSYRQQQIESINDRQRTTWMDNVSEWSGCVFQTLLRTAEDQKHWRSVTDTPWYIECAQNRNLCYRQVNLAIVNRKNKLTHGLDLHKLN